MLLFRVPSFATYVKLSGPEYPVAGVYVNEPLGLSVNDAACAGPVTSAAVSVLPSASVSFDRTPGVVTLSSVFSVAV
jgi:hypothetical protein